MRVLVTRPEPASARTAAELERRGHEPVLLPLMQAIHEPHALVTPALPDTAAIAVTSAEAIRVLEALPQENRQALLALPLFAVGRATARAASDAGFADVSIADGDGRSLASLLVATHDATTPILYLTGTPRSPDFETDLQQAGRAIDVRECYRMVPAAPDDLDVIETLTPMPEAILVYSAETARRIGELHHATRDQLDWQQVRFLCLSEKIARALPAEIQPNSQWSMEPREDQLLLLL
ncbi:uroporphyrinogen III synthase [Rhizobium sp. TH135]|uniref:uroporphyrinogen-III synthase n=1 Tax=Rhizobium sp. TH135 TaxID=2067451 RepID=UPI000C7A02F2|nr:uroporphyrinogen-III synthase [Rhizobium sp. TH135]PLK69941.1 uroporphyrinogen III synthase [Rhizobium sp. TH135]